MNEGEAVLTAPKPEPKLIIGDGGAQYRDLIYWKAASMGIRSEIVPFDSTTVFDTEKMLEQGQAMIIAGSNRSVSDADAPSLPPEMLRGEIATFGICFGAQLINHELGGVVGKLTQDGENGHKGEFGTKTITVNPDSITYAGMKAALNVLMNHNESVLQLADGLTVTGMSDSIVASFESSDGRVVGTQYHPEVNETEDGEELIERFLKVTAGLEADPDYNEEVALKEYLEQEEAKLATILENGGEITGLISGGVDSAVIAKMALKVASKLDRVDQLDFYFIDNGLMRTEDEDVVRMLADAGIPVKRVDAANYFFNAPITLIDDETGQPYTAGPLSETADPQLKRRLIGQAFLDVAESLMAMKNKKAQAPQYLLQGTNSADFTESGGNGGDVIKHHHNVTPETDAMRASGHLLEPLRIMLKHHVRKAAIDYYDLPKEVAYRQPFPGPGFGPRIVANLEGKLDKPDDFEAQQAALDQLVSGDHRAHLVCLKTVGNKGDGRSLAHVVVIEGTADWDALPQMAQDITDTFEGVNRVFFAPGMRINRADIQGVMTKVHPATAAELKRMEEVKRKSMAETGMDDFISQYFVATLGFTLTGEQKPTLALRLFITGNKLKEAVARRGSDSQEDFYTGLAGIPGVHVKLAHFNKLIRDLNQAKSEHSGVLYDITTKPPGSTENE